MLMLRNLLLTEVTKKIKAQSLQLISNVNKTNQAIHTWTKK